MRKINFLWLLGIIMLIPMSFTSCSGDDNENLGSSNDLIGTWQSVSYSSLYKENGKIIEQFEDEKDDEFKFVFNKDKTYKSYYYQISSKQWRVDSQGTWSYEGGKIYMYDHNGKEEDTAIVKKLTSSQLVVEYYDKYTESGIQCEDYLCLTYHKISN